MLKHNKKRNVRIIYEQLVSVMTRLAANGNTKEARYVLALTQKHFNTKSILGQELKLFETVLTPIGCSKENASHVLNETLAQASKVDQNKIKEAQDALIADIKKKLSDDVFNIPVKEFKSMASAQIMLNDVRGLNFTTSPVERVKLKNFLVGKISTQPKVLNEEKIDNFTYKIAVEKFNKKYSKIMNEDQKEILGAYSKFLMENDSENFKKVLDAKKEKLETILSENLNNSFDDAEVSSLIKEGYSKLNSLEIKDLNEQVVYEIMRYFDVAEDLSSEEEK